jgi:hypothetical protein
MHSKCPLTGQRLQSKQLSGNRALQTIIADWAAAPTYTPVLTVIDPSPSTAPCAASIQAAAPHSVNHTALSMPHLEGSDGRRITTESPLADQQQQQQQQQQLDSIDNSGKDPSSPGKSWAASRQSAMYMLRKRYLYCSRTQWAVALITLMVVLGVAVGVGVGVSTRAVKGRSCATYNLIV